MTTPNVKTEALFELPLGTVIYLWFRARRKGKVGLREPNWNVLSHTGILDLRDQFKRLLDLAGPPCWWNRAIVRELEDCVEDATILLGLGNVLMFGHLYGGGDLPPGPVIPVGTLKEGDTVRIHVPRGDVYRPE
jgi:hypothetical protein